MIVCGQGFPDFKVNRGALYKYTALSPPIFPAPVNLLLQTPCCPALQVNSDFSTRSLWRFYDNVNVV